MSSLSRISLCGALTGLAVLIGATAGPANAHLTSNSLTPNALSPNALGHNALMNNGATPNRTAATASTALGELNGVVVEALILPLHATH